MRIEELEITSDEIPINENGFFRFPIHYGLLDEEVSIDRNIPRISFQKAANKWHSQIKETLKDPSISRLKRQELEKFVCEKPLVVTGENILAVTFGREGIYHCSYNLEKNGFMDRLSLATNSGCAYFNPSDERCNLIVCSCFDADMIRTKDVLFKGEKLKEFKRRDLEEFPQLSTIHIYGLHNVDNFPQGMLLRQWLIEYMNEALRTVAD